MLNKPKIRLVIDALMFLAMAALAGLGLLMKYVLVSGKEAQVIYSTRVNLYFLGLDRHDWGTIHLYIAYALAGLLVIHIFLNWKQILNMFRKLLGTQMTRQITALVFIIVCLLLIVFPFMVNPEAQVKASSDGGGRGDRGGGRGHVESTQTTTNVPSEWSLDPS